MPGSIKIMIGGDASKYLSDLKRVDQVTDNTKKRTDNLHKDTITKDDVINARVDDTVQRANAAFAALSMKSKAEVEAGIRIQTEKYQMVMQQLSMMGHLALKRQEVEWTQETDTLINDTGRRIRAVQDDHEVLMTQLNLELERFKIRSRLTVNTALIALRGVTDIAALVSVASGERMDVAFLSMMSMGISQVMQVKMQAAIFAATPGMQPIALAMLSMVPMLTGMLSFIKSEQMKIRQMITDVNSQQLDMELDDISY